MLNKKKYAILSMDVEDWYHLDYFRHLQCDRAYDMLDGLDNYAKILESHNILTTFFVLGDLVLLLKNKLLELNQKGHEIASHGWSHQRPLNMTIEDFATDISSCKSAHEDTLGIPALGYRAPCFSFDRNRLDILKQSGFKYDSSKILFTDHPLYANLNIEGYEEKFPGISCFDDFYEFEASTLPIGGKRIPVSGGGYLRMFPWFLMRSLLKSYLRKNDLYVLYIHPFELSTKPSPTFPHESSLASQIRFSLGREKVSKKLDACIKMLKSSGFEFTTFSSLREKMIDGTQQ